MRAWIKPDMLGILNVVLEQDPSLRAQLHDAMRIQARLSKDVAEHMATQEEQAAKDAGMTPDWGKEHVPERPRDWKPEPPGTVAKAAASLYAKHPDLAPDQGQNKTQALEARILAWFKAQPQKSKHGAASIRQALGIKVDSKPFKDALHGLVHGKQLAWSGKRGKASFYWLTARQG